MTLVLLLSAAPTMAVAQAGLLDPLFGTGGISLGPQGVFRSVDIQPDGKIVAVGYDSAAGALLWIILRCNPDGSPDASFGGGDGIVTLSGPYGAGGARDLALLPDGRIVVVGWFSGPQDIDLGLVRLLPDGSLDTSFGTGGYVLTNVFSSGNMKRDEATAVAIQPPEGKIVVGGWSRQKTTTIDQVFVIARYTSSGALDTAASGGFGPLSKNKRPGFITDNPTSGADEIRIGGLVLQPDGRIVVAGGDFSGVSSPGWIVARYTTSGSLDPTFGTSGRVIESFPAESRVWGVAMQGTNVIASGRYATSGQPYDFAVVRYTDSGVRDTTFGNGTWAGGIVRTGIPVEDQAAQVVVQSDLKIVAGGNYYDGSPTKIMLFRWRADGTPDASFGPYGTGQSELASILGVSLGGYGLALDPSSSSTVIVGAAGGGPSYFAAAKYRN